MEPAPYRGIGPFGDACAGSDPIRQNLPLGVKFGMVKICLHFHLLILILFLLSSCSMDTPEQIITATVPATPTQSQDGLSAEEVTTLTSREKVEDHSSYG